MRTKQFEWKHLYNIINLTVRQNTYLADNKKVTFLLSSTVTESNRPQWFCRPSPRLTVRCIWPQPDLNRASATWKAVIITFRLWGRSAYDRIWTCGIRVKSPLPYRLATYANIVSIYNVYTGTRTQNLTVKSRLLCQLSYIHKKPFIHRGQTVLN